MPKISHQCLCDYSGESLDRFYRLQAKGGAIACALAYPSKESFGASGCEKAVSIATDAFVHRPSMSDKAPPAITGFLNEALYIIQEPRKLLFCNAAMLYVLNGQFRCILSGTAKLWHFNGGELVNTFDGSANPLFGKHLKPEFTYPEVVNLPRGVNAFLLWCGHEEPALDTAALGKAADTAADAEQWLSAVPAVKEQPGSLLAVLVPERKSLLRSIFRPK